MPSGCGATCALQVVTADTTTGPKASGSQCVVPAPASLVSFGNLLEIQVHMPLTKYLNKKLGLDPVLINLQLFLMDL